MNSHGAGSRAGAQMSAHPRQGVGRLFARSRDAFQVDVEGADRLVDGGAILAANHRWFGDITRLFSAFDRPVFLAVAHPRRFARRQVPVDGRDDDSRPDARALLRAGELVMIQPETERSPDGDLHRGSPDVAWLALTARVPVHPVDIVPPPAEGPVGEMVSALLGPTVRIGEPLDFSRYWTTPAISDVLDGILLRGCTDEIMAAIAELSGQLYRDDTPQQARVRLAEERREERKARAKAYPTLSEERRREAQLREQLRLKDQQDLARAAEEARARVTARATRDGEDPRR
ncbi:1-acyl-sn-glycerol-3-phosphate acyltransferase [Propionibacterium cyclohexanicum]|uniref:1-acyl-sn-glycerol-3-phosphate acyltransferase n=1 Tax=Propionibacterium cyclohexanicum TaxID=64702 RepID=A0A1H9PIR6_9ACTN|nr:lysophospholipid acyltransferase family protein [Propionibacterium cyclohexanicum]SER47980.1 1-acyl-sn-glycerol-3-phosphate acyltransferase [Propionibacterium cyclohexanicum]